MAQPDPPSRGGAHRAPATPGTVARNLTGPLIAVAAVVVVIVLLVFLNGRPTHRDTPAVQQRVTTASTSSIAPTIPSTPSPTHPRAPSPTAARTTAAPAPVGVAEAPVTVLNNSTYAGLARKVAAQIRAEGWPVADVGNFTGRVAETTIYYAPGQEQAAHVFAARFPKVQRVLPRFPALPGAGLTLVVTRHWVD